MKKTIGKILVVMLVVLLMPTLLVACNVTDTNPSAQKKDAPTTIEHEHTYSEDWEKDLTYHWHAATCGHTNEVSGKAKHSFNSGVLKSDGSEKLYTCSACGYTKTEVIPKVEATIKRSRVNLSNFQINIPEGTKYLGITTNKGIAVAAAESDDDSPEVSQYLSAFSDINELLNKQITFSQVRKVFLSHELIDVYSETTTTITTDRPIYETETDPEGNIIQKLDDNNQPIQATDSEGNLLFETEEVTTREKVGEEYKILYSYIAEGTVLYAIHETVNNEKYYYTADVKGELVLTEGQKTVVTLPEDFEWEYVYEKDSNGLEILRTERVGNVIDYVYADIIPENELDAKEKIVEVTIEKTQGEFSLDIIKLKVVNNFAFICFSVPIPDECYSGGTYTIEEVDGTITRFTSADLPERKTDANADYYDSVKYYTNVFVQSYVIDINTEKIYSLEGFNIDEVDEFGLVTIAHNIYEVRLEDNSVNLTFRDITIWANDTVMETINTYKDRNGIIYVQSLKSRDIEIMYVKSVKMFIVYYPYTYSTDWGGNWKTPYIFFDASNNAYVVSEEQLKKIEGIETTSAGSYKFILSKKDYSRGEEKLIIKDFVGINGHSNQKIDEIFFYDGKLFILKQDPVISYVSCGYRYLISNVSDLTYDKFVTYPLFGGGSNGTTIRSAVAYGLKNNDSEDKKIFSYVYNDGIIYIDTNIDSLRVVYMKHRAFIDSDELSSWSPVYRRFMSDYDADIYIRELTLKYNGNILSFEKIIEIYTPEYDSEAQTILVAMIEGRNSEGVIPKYYFSIDLEKELPDYIECYSSKDSAEINRTRIDTSYIITIQPIN